MDAFPVTIKNNNSTGEPRGCCNIPTSKYKNYLLYVFPVKLGELGILESVFVCVSKEKEGGGDAWKLEASLDLNVLHLSQPSEGIKLIYW